MFIFYHTITRVGLNGADIVVSYGCTAAAVKPYSKILAATLSTLDVVVRALNLGAIHTAEFSAV